MAKQVQGKPRAAAGTAPSEGRQVTTANPSGEGLPHLPGDFPLFVLKSHPNRWQLFGDELLPALGNIKMIPGAACVTETGDWSMAKARAEAEGWTIIPYEVIDGGYVREHDSSRKDTNGNQLHFYTDRWQKPFAVAGRPEMERDEDGYRTFLRELIRIGMIPLPSPQFLDKFADRVRQRLLDLAAAGLKKPAQEDAANGTLKAIDKMRLDLESNPSVYETYTGPKVSLPDTKAATPDPKIAVPKSGGRKVAMPSEEGEDAEP
jgi:hypothetical protein